MKKVHKRLFFLRRLRKFGMSHNILRLFYTCTVESILTGCITVWYRNSIAFNRKALQREIVALVAAELAQQSSLEVAAQSVVERVKRLHHDAYVSGRQRAPHCTRHEDMTLLVRVINYPFADGSLTPTQGGRIYPVSVPYSNHQSTSKTSVTLSLVMPSQGTLNNGSNTASTLEGDTPTAGQSPTATLLSTNTHTQSSSSSDGNLFRQRGSQAAQPDETGRVPPYVDFTQFYRLWGTDHGDGQGLPAELGPQ
ncbi:TGF-beta-activated kinase 1 and MAP3K7-binding protein 1-like [Myxocyprinus asiaticus]|uniref:TGF-beta-activated kinase 1 and MAP3K7-binding protein 1-like n=1 Tax=Myxocyprinus asiaticus TaxID=70543 RepID=UPI002221402C|nr:TGF-beta-activated kinase 1 and MAP3K7-binding protein 1-like [Myxocyprinus asiaticus]